MEHLTRKLLVVFIDIGLSRGGNEAPKIKVECILDRGETPESRAQRILDDRGLEWSCHHGGAHFTILEIQEI